MAEQETPQAWDNGTPAHASLAEALAAFQAELPKLRKTETAKVTGESKSGAKVSYSYGYTGLDQVVETALPVAGKHGLSISSKTTFADGNFMLEVTLLHENGERETGYWPLPDPRRSGPQEIGSAMTYGRRYETLALLGLAPGGEDDDGSKAQQAPRDSWESAQPRQRQAPVEDRQALSGEEPQAAPAPTVAPKTSWSDEEVMAYQDKLPTVTPANAAVLYDWMARKDLHERKVGASGRTATLMLALTLADRAMLPDSTVEEIDVIKEIAATRGLGSIKVGATENLDQALYEARELAVHAYQDEANDTAAVLAEEQGD